MIVQPGCRAADVPSDFFVVAAAAYVALLASGIIDAEAEITVEVLTNRRPYEPMQARRLSGLIHTFDRHRCKEHGGQRWSTNRLRVAARNLPSRQQPMARVADQPTSRTGRRKLLW
jgi:hypothetical protein